MTCNELTFVTPMEQSRSREASRSPHRERPTLTSVTDLHRWLDQRIDELITVARHLLDGDPSLTARAALRVMQAAEALALTRRQGQRVYQAAIGQLRVIALEHTRELKSPSRAPLRARAASTEEGYRELILRLNPRAVIGDLL